HPSTSPPTSVATADALGCLHLCMAAKTIRSTGTHTRKRTFHTAQPLGSEAPKIMSSLPMFCSVSTTTDHALLSLCMKGRADAIGSRPCVELFIHSSAGKMPPSEINASRYPSAYVCIPTAKPPSQVATERHSRVCQ